jgi:hypothetical protein
LKCMHRFGPLCSMLTINQSDVSKSSHESGNFRSRLLSEPRSICKLVKLGICNALPYSLGYKILPAVFFPVPTIEPKGPRLFLQCVCVTGRRLVAFPRPTHKITVRRVVPGMTFCSLPHYTNIIFYPFIIRILAGC